ncbi:hypothetical protein XELAEV_18038831mg [Xenopus laevis]|uniref:Uncharacterized protein n=1 Tax=Xenopus laevis TaxID=8355 RepID=A0A974H7A3_XENLA|nr:hypothetical protein XELAEV_18038831mg [Xenopus laevis]
MYTNYSNKCWRCNKEEGTYIHICLSCPCLNHYWEDIVYTINRVTKNALTLHLLQAKSMIPAKWKSSQPLNFFEWIAKVEEIRRLKELTLILENNRTKYWKAWSPWLDFIKGMSNM